MISSTRRTLTVLPMLVAAWLPFASVQAQAFPDKPIQLVVAYAPGGTGDLVAGAVSEPLAKSLGVPLSISHDPGGSGTKGTGSVVKAPPDGYKLLVGQTAEIAVNPTVTRNLGYDPVKDLRPVALLATVPLVLAVSSSSKYQSVQDVVDASRSGGRALAFASAGRATPGYFAGELLRLRSQGSFAHASYDGGGPALDDLVKGKVDLYFPALPTAMEQVRQGRLRILAVSSRRRSPALPDIPTMSESGVPDFDLDLWVGLFAPKDTPADTVAKLNKSVNAVLAQPAARERLASLGVDVSPMSQQELSNFVSRETDRYRNFISREFCSQCPW